MDRQADGGIGGLTERMDEQRSRQADWTGGHQGRQKVTTTQELLFKRL
jgi:hypothetical protein